MRTHVRVVTLGLSCLHPGTDRKGCWCAARRSLRRAPKRRRPTPIASSCHLFAPCGASSGRRCLRDIDRRRFRARRKERRTDRKQAFSIAWLKQLPRPADPVSLFAAVTASRSLRSRTAEGLRRNVLACSRFLPAAGDHYTAVAPLGKIRDEQGERRNDGCMVLLADEQGLFVSLITLQQLAGERGSGDRIHAGERRVGVVQAVVVLHAMPRR